VAVVVINAVSYAKPLHGSGQIGLMRPEEKIMIAHQNIRPYLQVKTLAARSQEIQETKMVFIVREYRPTIIAAMNDMIECVCLLYS
jgi:hypothetical protein